MVLQVLDALRVLLLEGLEVLDLDGLLVELQLVVVQRHKVCHLYLMLQHLGDLTVQARLVLIGHIEEAGSLCLGVN